jgi:hypothetical protein
MKSTTRESEEQDEYLVADILELVEQNEFEEWMRPDDLIGVPLRFLAVEVRQGKYGEYLLITAERLDTNQQIRVMTGGRYLRKIFDKVMEHGLLPFRATFARQGRTWVVR